MQIVPPAEVAIMTPIKIEPKIRSHATLIPGHGHPTWVRNKWRNQLRHA